MNILSLIIYLAIFGYIGSLCAKLWAGNFTSQQFNQLHFLKRLIPFHAILFTDFRSKNYKTELFCETFSILTSITFFFSLLVILERSPLTIIGIVTIFVFLSTVFYGLLYLALYDIRTYSIPADIIRSLLIFIIIIEGLVAIFSTLFHYETPLTFVGFTIGGLSNLIGGIAGFLLIKMIVTFTDNKGMGEGDIDTSASIGFVLGFTYFWLSFLITVLVGFVLSIGVILFKKKYKGYVIPFVPLQLIGFVIVLGFGKELAQILLGL